MKKKSLSSSGFLNLRTLIGLLLCAATACSVLIPMKSGLAYLHPQAPANSSQRTLTFEERVSYQRAIEDVYWRHRIWPKERPDPKPSLDAVMSQAQLEKKVEDYLRKSQALENYWQRPITAKQLQAEVDRMANHTKQPEVLRELFEALGNDPFVIAECLARPALVERLLASWYAYDQRIHGELKQRAEAELQTHPAVGQMKQLSGKYGEIELVRKESAHAKDNRAARNSVKLNNHEWNQTVQKLVGIFSDGSVAAGVSPANDTSITHLKAGTVSPLQEDETRYYVTTVVNKTNDHLKLATVSWPKEVTQVIPRALGQRGQRDISQRTSDAPSNLDGGTWTVTNSLNTARYLHTTTLLPNGMVLVAGGLDNTFTATASAELYNPANGTWTPTGSLNTARTNHTATLLTNGRVLVAGGLGSGALASAELYDPATGTWTVTGSLNTARESHTATLLSNGMVLVAAGYDSNTHVPRERGTVRSGEWELDSHGQSEHCSHG